jgi:RND family efflux transporter MFP subunit
MRTEIRARFLTTAAGSLAVLLLLGCEVGNGAVNNIEDQAASTLLVRTAPVQLTTKYRVRETFAGRVESRRSSNLGFDRAGRVVDLGVDEGDRVEQGDLLASLETRDLRAELREFQARRRATAARLELARRTTARRETLADRESISQQAFDEAHFDQEALRAELEASNAGIARVEVMLELSELRAPFPGIVVMRSVDEGTVATPGQAILRIIEVGPLELRVGLPLATADALDPDASYVVEVEGAERTARLHARLPEVDPQTRTLTAIFHIDAVEGGAIADGTLGRLVLETARPGKGYWLPMTALTEGRRGLWSAYAIAAAENPGLFRVERRELQVVHVEADRAYVTGTLKDGDRIVTTGVHRIVQGQLVRATEETARSQPSDTGEGADGAEG